MTGWLSGRAYTHLFLFLTLTLFTPTLFATEALWIAESEGALKLAAEDGSVLQEITVPGGIDSIAIHPSSKNIWVYKAKTIMAFAPDGTQFVNVNHPTLKDGQPEDMQVDDNGVWIALRKRIHKFDLQGQLLLTINEGTKVRAASLDRTRSNIWSLTKDKISAYDSSGTNLFDIQAGTENFHELVYDPDLDEIWVSVNENLLRRYDTSGTQTTEFDVGIGDFRQDIHPDGNGGVWGRTNLKISYIDAQGNLIFNFRPFDGYTNFTTTTSIANNEDQTMWVANDTTLKQYDTTGAELNTLVPDLGDGIIRNIFHMDIEMDAGGTRNAPSIQITAPQEGSLVNTSSPNIELSFTDNGSGVDVNSVEIQVNGSTIATTCTGDATTATCTPNNPIADGQVMLGATVADTSGNNVSDPDQVTFTIDTIAPVITFTSPADNSFTNDANLTVDGQVSENVQSLTVNGVNVIPDASNNFSSVVTLTEGNNIITVVATDLANNQTTESRTVTLVVDTTIPTIPYTPSIYINGPVNGIVTIIGSSGSVDPNISVILTNERTGETTTVSSDENGAFQADLSGVVGDTYIIQTENTSGANSAQQTITVGDPISVTITSPSDGQSLVTDKILVTGALEGDLNTGVSVNGITAVIDRTNGVTQYTALVPLASGTNTITAIAANQNNQIGNSSITVTSSSTPLFRVAVSDTSGIAPFDVEYSISQVGDEEIQQITVDYDGDGTIDLSTTDTLIENTFSDVGLFFTEVTVVSDNGSVFTQNIPIKIETEAEIDQIIQPLWQDFKTSLSSSNVNQAVNLFAADSQQKYQNIFEALGSELPNVVSSFSDLQKGGFTSSGIAEYAINRTINGTDYIFLVYFIKDDLGVWRIYSM